MAGKKLAELELRWFGLVLVAKALMSASSCLVRGAADEVPVAAVVDEEGMVDEVAGPSAAGR